MIKINELKKWIVNDNLDISDFVLNYITDRKLGDLETTRLTLKAYYLFKEDYNSYKFLYHISQLPRDFKILEEINNLIDDDINTTFYKNKIIAHSDLTILKEYPHIRPKGETFITTLKSRFEYSQMDTLKLWNELWEFSIYLSEQSGRVDYYQGFLIIDELVQRDDFPATLLYDKLNEYIKDRSIQNNLFYCNNLFLTQLIGHYQYIDGIPYLFDRLNEEDEFLNEIASKNLILMNHDEVLKSIQRNYSKESVDYQFHALKILEKINSTLSEEILIDLFHIEKDLCKKTMIASGLCHQLSIKSIPYIVQFIRDGYDKMYTLLEEEIYITCLLNQIEHEDLSIWESKIKEVRQKQKERQKAMAELVRQFKNKRKNHNPLV